MQIAPPTNVNSYSELSYITAAAFQYKMERNLFQCCIPQCFGSSSRARCPCRLKKFRNRVGPSKAVVFSVSKGMSPSPEAELHPAAVASLERRHSKFNGETNQYFREDEVNLPGVDGHVNGLNGDVVKDEGTIDSEVEQDRISFGEELECSLSEGFYEFLQTVFLQLSKSKQLRVIHIKSKDVDESVSMKRSAGTGVNGLSTSSSDEEDDDYWFSKWSRRPKLKNTFKPNSTNHRSRSEVLMEINARTTFTYEEIKDLKEDADEDSERQRKGSDEPPRCNESPPPSPRTPKFTHISEFFDHSKSNCVESLPSPPNGRTSANANILSLEIQEHSKATDNYETKWQGLDDVFQPDSNGNDVREQSPAAFTNFGFQLDPEDHPPTGQEDFRLNSENPVLSENDLVSDVVNGNAVPVEPIKTNGFVRHSSPPPKTKSELANGHVTAISEPPLDDRASDESSENVPCNSKPLLFFIHGISGASDIWKAQFKYFHELGYEIVAPDLLGHGLSSTPDKAKHYFFESLVQDLVSVFDHFVSENRRSVIIGHGYGACMGTVLSRNRSQNVSLLISVSGGGPTPLIPYGCLERPFLPIRFNFRKKKSIGRFDNPDLRHVLPESIHEHILNGQLWVDGDAAFHRRISVPTLLVHGMRDTVVSLIEECEMERTIPKAFLELLPTAGHMVMWDDPANFNKMLITFIEAWADSQTN